MSKSRVTVVTDYFYPDQSSTSYYITEIARTLSIKTEGNIRVICSSNLKRYKELSFVKNKIIRISENKLNKNNYFLRIFRILIVSIKLSFFVLFNVNKKETIFTYTLAFLILMLALIKKIKKFKYVLLVYDVFPENLVAAKLLKKNSFFYKTIKKIFDWSYNQSDHLIVIGRDMEELMKKKTYNSIPVSLITNWCDVNKIKFLAKDDNKIINDLKLKKKIVFSVVGNLGRLQGINFLLEVSSKVKSPNFILLFIGKGALVKKIKKHINNSAKKNVVYAGHFPPSKNNVILNACDVSIVSLNKSMYGLGGSK